MEKRERRQFSDEFKKQIVMLYENGKKVTEIIEEYNLSPSLIYQWAKRFNYSGSFKAKDNRTDQEKEFIALQKEVKQLRMENDILKQAALIMGQKSKS